VKTINLGGVNCYLLHSPNGSVLIDSGFSARRAKFVEALDAAGCRPGNLKLVVLTHGDSDHAGNAAYLRDVYGAKLALHDADSGMVEHGDMGWNRKAEPDEMSWIMKAMSFAMGKFLKPGAFQTFIPDLRVEEGFDLSPYGVDARIIQLPGHSKGSIGVLLPNGDLFCGDFLYNMPGLHFIDNKADHEASLKKLKSLNIATIYPGHGKPFPGKRRLARS
jgi:hydroxyacylglutathione hydrolase